MSTGGLTQPEWSPCTSFQTSKFLRSWSISSSTCSGSEVAVKIGWQIGEIWGLVRVYNDLTAYVGWLVLCCRDLDKLDTVKKLTIQKPNEVWKHLRLFLLRKKCTSLRDTKISNSILQIQLRRWFYKVTHQVVTNLPLTSKQKFRFGLARPGQARPKQNFCFEVNRRFVTAWCVTLFVSILQLFLEEHVCIAKVARLNSEVGHFSSRKYGTNMRKFIC